MKKKRNIKCISVRIFARHAERIRQAKSVEGKTTQLLNNALTRWFCRINNLKNESKLKVVFQPSAANEKKLQAFRGKRGNLIKIINSALDEYFMGKI